MHSSVYGKILEYRWIVESAVAVDDPMFCAPCCWAMLLLSDVCRALWLLLLVSWEDLHWWFTGRFPPYIDPWLFYGCMVGRVKRETLVRERAKQAKQALQLFMESIPYRNPKRLHRDLERLINHHKQHLMACDVAWCRLKISEICKEGFHQWQNRKWNGHE